MIQGCELSHCDKSRGHCMLGRIDKEKECSGEVALMWKKVEEHKENEEGKVNILLKYIIKNHVIKSYNQLKI